MISDGVILPFGTWIQAAENGAKEHMHGGEVEDEPSLSGIFFESIVRVFRDHQELQGFTFRVRIVRGVGRNAPEARYGADACALLKIDVPGLHVTKGVMIQSKWAHEPHISMNIKTHPTPSFTFDEEFRRMQGQCTSMLKITPDAFVIVYSPAAFSVTPASSIQGVDGSISPISLYSKGLSPFFKEFLMCFIGDPKIITHKNETLDQLVREYELRNGLEMTVSRKLQE
jgi:hypothetical protein